MHEPGKVTERIHALLVRCLDRRGIVVWYDPRHTYEALVDRMDINATLFRYEDGFFRLRERIEPQLEWVRDDGNPNPDALYPPRMIVYVPTDRGASEHALIEAETAGILLEPSAPDLERDTRLGRIVEEVFHEIQPARAAHLARQADDGLLTLEELDRMAEEAGGEKGALALVFGSTSSADIMLSFLSDPSLDADIEAKDAIPELTELLENDTGFEAPEGASVAEMRKLLEQHLLILEPALYVTADELPPVLRDHPPPESASQREMIRVVCRQWRDRISLRHTYAEAADRIEAYLGSAVSTFVPRSLAKLETFRGFEHRLLCYAMEQIIAGIPQDASGLAASRIGSFWSRERPELGLQWALVTVAAQILITTENVGASLAGRTFSVDELIGAYASGNEPWYLIDRFERLLEIRYAHCISFDVSNNDLIEAVMSLCRRRYAEVLDTMTRAFTGAFVTAGLSSDNVRRHIEVYGAAVGPALAEGNRVAYLLVDALRYEMAGAVMEALEKEYESAIEPAFAQLPGLTSVGMAALLPDAESGLEVGEEGPSMSVAIRGKALRDRAARLEWISERAGFPAVCMKLSEVLKHSSRKKKDLQNAQLVVVTSQEIDRRGEEAEDDDEVRRYMDEVLEKIGRAVRILSSDGIDEIVISADHGFFFTEQFDPGLLMDPPGGHTVALKGRAWVGRGGAGGDGFIRLKAHEIGLTGDLEFAFPSGIGAFRTRGGVGRYHHGGMSLQESVVPVCRLRRRAVIPGFEELTVELKLDRSSITSRFFSVQVTLKPGGLTAIDPSADDVKRIRIEVLSGSDNAGSVVLADRGFDESTREIVLELGKTVEATVQLTADSSLRKISLHVVDCESGLVIARMADIPVSLMI